jgi:hypothetical protein
VGSTATPFTSPDGYSLIPPTGWTKYPDGAVRGVSVAFLAPAVDPTSKFVDNINVVINANQKDLQSTIAETKQALPIALTHYRLVIDQPAIADGQQAHLLGGTFDRQESGHLENLQQILIAGGKQYTVTFTSPAASFEALRDPAQASLLSFHLA